MKNIIRLAFLSFVLALGWIQMPTARTAPSQTILAPVLKWGNGGCYSSWCETGWYSSPAVADLDGDGTMEVIGAAYTLFVLNGEDGSVQWSVDPPAAGSGPVRRGRRSGRGRRPGDRHRQRWRLRHVFDHPGATSPSGRSAPPAMSSAPWPWMTWRAMAIWKSPSGRRDWTR